jgi:hypothetical protein
LYVTPAQEIVEAELEGFLCASDGLPDTTTIVTDDDDWAEVDG